MKVSFARGRNELSNIGYKRQQSLVDDVMKSLNVWFDVNKLILKLQKTKLVYFPSVISNFVFANGRYSDQAANVKVAQSCNGMNILRLFVVNSLLFVALSHLCS